MFQFLGIWESGDPMLKYALPQKSGRKDFVYNMFGSLANALVSVILLVVVSHTAGDAAAGVFSLAFSSAQMMYTIGVFEMRNIQVTDVKGSFSFSEVLGFRILTIGAMFVFCACFLVLKGYGGQKGAAIAMLCVYMALLALSDVFQGNAQLRGYLSIGGKSLGGQVLLAAAAFSVALAITKDLLLSIAVMTVVPLLWILLYDLPYQRNFSQDKPVFRIKTVRKILLLAAPLFICSFLQQYIFNQPKFSIDRFLTDVDQSYYGYLVMPTFFINLLSIFVFRPQLVTLAENWTGGKFTAFRKTVAMLYLWVLIVTAAALLLGYLIGIPVLELLYGADLTGQRSVLMVLLLAGSMSALCSLTGTLLTILRRQQYSLIAFGTVFLLSLAIPDMLVRRMALIGAAAAYLFEMTLLFGILMVIFFIFLRRGQKEFGQ